MLSFGNVTQNLLTILILFGLGYIMYTKWKGGDGKLKDLFSKAGEIVEKVNLKGGGGGFGK